MYEKHGDKFLIFSLVTDREWKDLSNQKSNFLSKLYDAAVQSKAFKSLLSMMDKSDIYLLERAFRVTGRLFDYDIRNFMDSELLNKEQENFVASINREMEFQGKETRNSKMATFALVLTVRKENVRETFFKLGGVKHLLALLDKHATNVQIIYEVCFCVWVLSFSKNRAPVYFQDCKIVPMYVNLLLLIIQIC